MKDKYRLFLAFFIPFSFTLFLVSVKMYIFKEITPFDNNQSGISFSKTFDDPPIAEQIYGLFISSLFLLSLILPAFVIWRSRPIERDDVKLIIDRK